MSNDRLAHRIERLREARGFKHRNDDAGPLFAQEGRALARMERRLGSAGGAWSAVCPPELIGKTEIKGLTRGVLTIGAHDAATRYEVDRMLRCGGDRALIERCAMTVRRVRVVLSTGGGQ